MKIFKTTFVFVLFFLCVCSLTAQVMETVTYTPSKSGRYGTITTKSLATFAGDVNVGSGQGQITGFGDKFVIDAKQGYSAGTYSAVFSAGRDIFTSVTAAPSGAYVGGSLNTTQNSTVGQLNAQRTVIYAGDANFTNSSVKVNKAGILEIDRVKMKNPNCDIKWVKLPAYKENADYGAVTNPTPTYYWFAYCDSDTNVVPNDWNANITTINALGTCLSHSGACVSDETNNALFKRYFTCDDIAVYQCTSGYSTRDELALYNHAVNNPNLLWVYNSNSTAPNGWCAGLIRRYPATPIWYGGSVSELVPTPVDSRRDHCGYSNRTLEAYCGLELNRAGTNSYLYRSYAQDAYYKMKHNDICTHSNTELTLCHELGNYSYSDWATVMTAYSNHTYSTEDLCGLIETGHGTSMSSFSCVLNIPNPNTFTYYKSAKTVVTSKRYFSCKNGHCYSDGGDYINGHLAWGVGEYCRMLNDADNYAVEDYPTGYVTATEEGYPNTYWAGIQGEYGKVGISGYPANLNSTQNTYCSYGGGTGSTLPSFGGYTYRTHYLNKKMQNTNILNCSRD
jgi:hypothetical protein